MDVIRLIIGNKLFLIVPTALSLTFEITIQQLKLNENDFFAAWMLHA